MIRVCLKTSPSGWNCGGCSQPFIASSSGKIARMRPLASSRSQPRARFGDKKIFTSSSRIRSALICTMDGALATTASQVAASISNPRTVANRTARSIRSRSSAKRCAGSPMARIKRRSRSPRPPTKSMTSSFSGSKNIPLMVKSRRAASSSALAKCTSTGCRPSMYAPSERKVATSN